MNTYSFIHSRSLMADELIGRQKPINRIFNKLITKQSSFIVGEPHIGKTSLLNYIMDDTKRREIFGNKYDNYILSYLDAQMLMGHDMSQTDFWQHALQPLAEFLESHNSSEFSEIANQYSITIENRFGNFSLDRLFSLLGKAGLCFVLILDEFDVLLDHQVLNSAEFFGGLRALASRTGGLALVTAGRQTIADMNRLTQELNPYGSPFFNIFTEIVLTPLSQKEANCLLDLAKENLSEQDRKFIQAIAGGHPYLLQIAADAILQMHEEEKLGVERYELAGHLIHRATIAHFEDTWRMWSRSKCKAIAGIALAEMPGLVSNRKFAADELIDDLPSFAPEINDLRDFGVITEIENKKYKVTQKALLFWLADEIIRQIRDDEASFDNWIKVRELDGLLTKGEKKKLGEVARFFAKTAQQATSTFIEAFAKGFGESWNKP